MSKKYPFHARMMNFERGCRMNGERATNVKYINIYIYIYILYIYKYTYIYVTK